MAGFIAPKLAGVNDDELLLEPELAIFMFMICTVDRGRAGTGRLEALLLESDKASAGTGDEEADDEPDVVDDANDAMCARAITGMFAPPPAAGRMDGC